jgi:enoyl-CoA hydratase/carnithine racemase
MPQVLARRDGAIATVVFSNPARFNALTLDMWKAVPQALAALDADPAIRVIVLEGDGDRAFVSGADISQFGQNRATPEAQAEYDRALDAAYLAPNRCSKPVIAKIRGICMGGGLGLAAGCDIRICSDDAAFRMPAARMGLAYGFVGMQRFMRLMGAANTADIFFSARKFDAHDALRMGFVQKVVAPAALDDEVRAYCKTIAENAPLTVAAAKRTLLEAQKEPADRDLAAVAAADRACFASTDFEEGRKAFMEKRPPRFQGS